jgi:curli biogenesis system outer membrane secretion channel CsgG
MSLALFSNAQIKEKIVVGVLPVVSMDNSKDLQNETSFITDEISNAFTKTNRFVLVDRTKLSVLNKEIELQKTEDFMDGSVAQEGKKMGAEYLIYTKLNGYSNDGNLCKFSLALTIMEVNTGKILSSESITATGGGAGKVLSGVTLGLVQGSNNSSDALRKSLKDIQPQIDAFVNKNFPVTFALTEVSSKNKKGEAVTVVVSGGSQMGIAVGNKLKISEEVETEVNGEKIIRNKVIGEVIVT